LKKAIIFLLTGAVMLVTLCLLPFTAFAAEAESVSIPVEIEGGGTAEIISEVNCPLPKESSLEVQDGATENINISFSVPGDYEYTIQAEAKDGLYYSPEYYTATVAVRADNSGKLTSTVILTKAGSNYKLDRCRFVIAEKQSDESEANAVTQPAGTAQTPKNPPTSRPQTGDDSMLDIYLLICIAAAGGLFMLAVIYSVSTERLIKR